MKLALTRLDARAQMLNVRDLFWQSFCDIMIFTTDFMDAFYQIKDNTQRLQCSVFTV